jgi:hypothetical protein
MQFDRKTTGTTIKIKNRDQDQDQRIERYALASTNVDHRRRLSFERKYRCRFVENKPRHRLPHHREKGLRKRKESKVVEVASRCSLRLVRQEVSGTVRVFVNRKCVSEYCVQV